MRAIALDALGQFGVAPLWREEYDRERAEEHHSHECHSGAHRPRKPAIRRCHALAVLPGVRETVAEELRDLIGSFRVRLRVGEGREANRDRVDAQVDAAERQERRRNAVVRVGVLEERVELPPRALGAFVNPRFPLRARVAGAGQFVAFGQDEEDREAADFACIRLALRDDR